MSNIILNALSASGALIVEDEYTVPDAQKVIFNCPSKKVYVEGILSGDITFDITASWQSALGTSGGSTGSSKLDTADRITQFITGYTIQQPWFSRKTYSGTTPIAFNIPMKFLAWSDAATQVTKPMVDLMSLLYPRLSANKSSQLLGGAVSAYHIPGPSLFWPNNIGLPGDNVEVRVGNLINYKGCYIEGLSIRVPNMYTGDGDPHMIEVVVKVSAIDTAFMKEDYTFNPLIDQTYEMGSLMTDLRKSTESGGSVIDLFSGLL